VSIIYPCLGSRVRNEGAELTDRSWVRSWILFRLAIISQGIAARASLGQASSADASSDNAIFDFFGRKSWEAKVRAENEEGGGKAKL
jgi:hypothetical protein